MRHGYQPWALASRVYLVLGAREDSYHERYQEPDKLEGGSTEIPWPIPFWWFDAGALFMLLQMAAVSEGLAAGFDSPADPNELAALGRIVNLPGDVATTGVLTLGLPAEDPAGGSARLAERRKPIDELVRWQRR